MMRRLAMLSMLGSSLFVLGTGCIVVHADGCWNWGGPHVWVEASEELTFDPAGVAAVEAKTHNGFIHFDGQPSGGSAVVRVTKKAGGLTQGDADEAMQAIVVFVERTGETQRVGWKWKGVRKPSWQADVSFDITAPGQVNLEAETHNGRLQVAGLVGDLRAVTHNGRMEIASRGGKLRAETHNGRITADYEGSDISLSTHNGEVTVDLSRCGSVSGDITTHNGGVEIAVGAKTSADLRCETHNGRVTSDAPITLGSASRTQLAGSLGAGGSRLSVVTHNGGIKVKKSAG